MPKVGMPATRGLRAIGALKVHGKGFLLVSRVGLFVMLKPQISTNKSDLTSLRKSESENRTIRIIPRIVAEYHEYETRE